MKNYPSQLYHILLVRGETLASVTQTSAANFLPHKQQPPVVAAVLRSYRMMTTNDVNCVILLMMMMTSFRAPYKTTKVQQHRQIGQNSRMHALPSAVSVLVIGASPAINQHTTMDCVMRIR